MSTSNRTESAASGGGVPDDSVGSIVGPTDSSLVPRFAGPATFARVPRIDETDADVDIAVVGVPFDAGTSFRPGARFGPAHIRESSRLLRPYNQAQRVLPFAHQQVVDAGDIVANPFDIAAALQQIEAGARDLLNRADRLVVLGGDHTIALPMLRAFHAVHGPVAVVHFDAHLDTWDTYFGAPYTHGTPFRRAIEEGLIDLSAAMHVGIRGPLYDELDLTRDRDLGFAVVAADEIDNLRATGIAERIVSRVGDRPLYLSIDVDVMDPAFTPGTGTPESGGLSSRELLAIMRGLAGCNLVGTDVVEVAPAYDHASITGVAASHVAYEALSLMTPRQSPPPGGGATSLVEASS
jgi:agmatinase